MSKSQSILAARTFKELASLSMPGGRLRELVVQGPPSSLIFAGLREDLMMRCAQVQCAALNCLAPYDGDACGHCDPCNRVFGPSVGAWVPAEGAQVGTAGARALTTLSSHVPFDGGWRVIAVAQAEKMKSPGFRQVCSLIDRPAPLTTLVLVSTEPWRLPRFVSSRAPKVEFGAPAE